jgi:tRNA modification GTPase
MSDLLTIFALSSGAGRAGVAVVRASGPQARHCMLGLAGDAVPPPRLAVLRTLRHPKSRLVLDKALVLWFPAPHSFTGEDCCEFHIHGGRAVLAGVLGALAGLEGVRLAEPGEFTRRAFENGKLDLTAAEGLADLIDAETEAQRLQALRQLDGGLGLVADLWRLDLVRAMGLVEAAIDFSDEADVSTRAVEQARAIVLTLYGALERVLNDGRRGEILRDGFKVVIAGPPNAGKSSLLNALARRDVAIVSEEPGTTRDVVEVRLDLCGVPILVMDTAGLRDAPGAVEREGIRRTLGRAQEADLVLWLVDAVAPQVAIPDVLLTGAAPVVLVVNKADLVHEGVTGALSVSAVTGTGLPGLVDEISRRAATSDSIGDGPVITRARHRGLLEACHARCGEFLDGSGEHTELRAEDLRRAAHALGQLTGRVDVEEVLGEIFGRFCIGK